VRKQTPVGTKHRYDTSFSAAPGKLKIYEKQKGMIADLLTDQPQRLRQVGLRGFERDI
jgi:hypothetical protein